MNPCLQAGILRMSECNFYVHLVYLPRNSHLTFLLHEGKGKSCSDYKYMIYSISTIALSVIKILHCCLSVTYWLQCFAFTKIFIWVLFWFNISEHFESLFLPTALFFHLSQCLPSQTDERLQIIYIEGFKRPKGSWYGH